MVGQEIVVFFQAQKVSDPHPKFGAIDRLGQEFLGAHVECSEPRTAVVQRRHHDDRDVARCWVELDPARDIEPRDSRHRNVKQNKVRLARLDRRQRLLAADRRLDLISFRPEQRVHQLQVARIIIDDEDVGAVGLHRVH